MAARIPLLLAAALALSACHGPTSPLPCPAGLAPAAIVTAYFGRNIGPGGRDGRVVDADWRDFQHGSIAAGLQDLKRRLSGDPLAGAGFSVFDGQGLWHGEAGAAPDIEATKIVTIIVPLDERDHTLRRVQEIADAYKRRFRQGAVGVTAASGCAQEVF